MLTHQHADANVEENIRRHANGSIDYGFYDQRARECRGVAFRSAWRPVAALVKRLSAFFAGNRTEQKTMPQEIPVPAPQRADQRRSTSASAHRTYPKAA